VPFYLPGNEPPGLEHLGLCALPSADPCATPGNCPPAGIDDTYPWCSLQNEALCDGDLYGGYDNGCEGGCLCGTPCEEDRDCPLPATGNAVPQCVEGEPGQATVCLLPCTEAACPDGMVCTTLFTGEPLCMWVTPHDGPFCE
jgi:hypothetical protein